MFANQDHKSVDESVKKKHTQENNTSFEKIINQFQIKPYPEPSGPLADEVPPGGSLPDTKQVVQNKKNAKETKPNNTGLPDNLKTGIENLSGISMDSVKVQYNSNQPSQLQAHAFTQGTNIHIAPGQEKHLPHEAWHVVQQTQGRVTPTMQLKDFGINDDKGLEKEASEMGAKAEKTDDIAARLPSSSQINQSVQLLGGASGSLQRGVVGSSIRQFSCGCCGGDEGVAKAKNISKDSTLIEREKLVTDGIMTKGNIIDVEVARNYLKKTNEVETITKKVQVYHIQDTNHMFYTATSVEASNSILANGLDPNYGGRRDPKTITGWNSQGHVYFTIESSTAKGYGRNVIKPSCKDKKFALLTFTLPMNHPVTLDPELGPSSNAFRTNQLIPATNFINREII